MQTDYIIAGQGIAGTLMAWQLMSRGQKVIVFDKGYIDSATAVASGLINPVTGKRVVHAWMYDELLAAALDTYEKLEEELGITVIRRIDMLNFFAMREEVAVFEKKEPTLPQHLSLEKNGSWQEYFHYHNGIGKVAPCYIIDTALLLQKFRELLIEKDCLIAETLDWNVCSMAGHNIEYKGITAKNIISCEGAAGAANPYFSLLPFALNKGDALVAHIPLLPQTHIYHQGIKLVPIGNERFWIGSSFIWEYEDVLPTTAFKKGVEEQLNYWLKLPHSIEKHYAAVRPATVDRRLFVGTHPKHPNLAILNGLGTKGCSLAPLFSTQLADKLVRNTAILPEADIKRFTNILSR